MLLLASESQRRTELLSLINVKHKVVKQNFDESSVTSSDPIICSKEIVKGKNKSALSLLDKSLEGFPILTSDTLVFSPNKSILGKPESSDHNVEMLKEFSGTTHSVFSSVMISYQQRQAIKTCETLVTFKKLEMNEIEKYVESGEGEGKAGGYGIHGPAGMFISKIVGSYTNVVGLPVHETYEILRSFKLL